MSNKLYNVQTKRYENVPSEAFQNGLRSGTYRIPVGQTIRVLAPDGEAFDADRNTNFAEIPSDYTLEDFSLKKQRELKEWGADNPTLATVAGAARGATFGLTDVAGNALGFKDELATLKTENPTASAVGEIGGTVASFLVPGAGLVGAASKVGAGVAAKTAVKLGVQEIAEGGASLAAKEIAKRALSKGAGSAIEASLYGVGQTVTEAALGDPKTAAENLLANVSINALIGGAFGGAFSGISDLTKKSFGNLSADTVSKAGEKYGKLLQKVRGSDDPAIDKLFKAENKNLRAKVVGYIEDPHEAVQQFATSFDSMQSKVDDLTMTLTHDVKERLAAEPLDVIPKRFEEAWKGASDVVDTMKRTISKAKADEALVLPGFTNKLETIHAKAETELYKIFNKEGATAGELYDVMTGLKRDMYSELKDYAKNAIDKGRSKDTVKLYDSVYNKIKNHMWDEKSYGQLGARTKEIDSAVAPVLDMKRLIQKRFFDKVDDEFGNKVFIPSETKIKRFLNDPKSLKNLEARKLLNSYYKKIGEVSKTSLKYSETQAGARGSSKAALLQKELAEELDNTRSAVRAVQALQGRTGHSLHSMLLGYGLGSVVGGPLGVGLAVAGSAAQNPVHVLKLLRGAERFAESNKQQIGGYIDTFLSKSRSAGTYAKPAFFSPINHKGIHVPLVEAAGDEKTEEFKYHFVMDKLNEQRANPTLVGEKVQERLGEFASAAPNVTQNAVTTAMRANEFLYSVAPKDPFESMQIVPGTRKWEPSKQVQNTFKKYVEAVNSPIGVMKDLSKGVYNKEGVEVLKNVYPQMYSQMKAQLIEKLSEEKRELSLQQKMILTKFLGVPALPAMTPDYLALLQKNMAINDVETKAKSANVEIGQKLITPLQQSLNRS